MPEITKVSTGSPFEQRESFSRLVVVGDWIFSSLTSGRNYTTREMPDDAATQAVQAFANVRKSLESVGSSLADVVRSRVFVPDINDVPAVMAVVGEHYRGIDPVSTVTCSPLAGEFKVEIEVTAFRGASALPLKRLEVDISAMS
ncbi:RidA family protein [Microbacterium atlanticum]|uniref:RidA family protein n=1 Tax=Microbacterium atlanticum TaxID=2782168 RepID=UPI001888B793|nr:RidA family protein [Microbacterium atlanticum]